MTWEINLWGCRGGHVDVGESVTVVSELPAAFAFVDREDSELDGDQVGNFSSAGPPAVVETDGQLRDETTSGGRAEDFEHVHVGVGDAGFPVRRRRDGSLGMRFGIPGIGRAGLWVLAARVSTHCQPVRALGASSSTSR